MASTSFFIPNTHPSLTGHFPDNPLVPGAIILDNVLSIAKDQGFKNIDQIVSVKFRAHLRSDEECHVDFVNGKRGIMATCLRDKTIILTCLFVPSAQ